MTTLFDDDDVNFLVRIERGGQPEADSNDLTETTCAIIVDRDELLTFLTGLRDVLRTGDATDRHKAVQAIASTLDTLRAIVGEERGDLETREQE
jgi:hypothetical protein